MPLSSVHHTLSLLFRWVAFHRFFQRRDAISRAFSLSVGCACVLLSNTMGRPERLDPSTSFLFLSFHRERLKPNTVINYSIDAFLIGGTGLTQMQQQGYSIWLRLQWMKVNAFMPQEKAISESQVKT